MSLTLRATDTENKSITILVPVTVTAAQDAPTVVNIPTVSAITYNSANISYNISDPDGLTNPICEVQTTTGTMIGSLMVPVNGVCAFV